MRKIDWKTTGLMSVSFGRAHHAIIDVPSAEIRGCEMHGTHSQFVLHERLPKGPCVLNLLAD